jgi:hypothetical protein
VLAPISELETVGSRGKPDGLRSRRSIYIDRRVAKKRTKAPGKGQAQLDMDKIARGLGAERRGKITASGGYFGALQLLADIEARFRAPSGGGRPTDARWTERRLVPLAPRTLKRLEEIAAKVRKHGGVSVEPMQLAALLLEKKTEELSEGEVENLVRPKRQGR